MELVAGVRYALRAGLVVVASLGTEVLGFLRIIMSSSSYCKERPREKLKIRHRNLLEICIEREDQGKELDSRLCALLVDGWSVS